jgi:hypothetical protein
METNGSSLLSAAGKHSHRTVTEVDFMQLIFGMYQVARGIVIEVMYITIGKNHLG